jgi:hypothetical protein
MPWWLARSRPRTPAVLSSASLVVVVTTLVGCASLVPERAPLKWSVEGVSRSKEPTAGEVRWNYTLVIENPGLVPATLLQEAVTLAWDGVYLSPQIDQTKRVIPARTQVRLPSSSIFRVDDFEVRRGSPGRPVNAPQQTKGMWVYWQFWGRYEGGGAIILNRDFFPGQIKWTDLKGSV